MKIACRGVAAPTFANSDQGRLSSRVKCALAHPDCPVLMTEFEEYQLAKHIATRLQRMWVYR